LLNYTSYIDPLYHILHIPTFLKQYERFWGVYEDSNNPSWRASFASQLSLVTIIVSQMQNSKDFTSQQRPFDPFKICATIEVWLSKLESKQRLQLGTLQTQCLFVLAQRMLSATSIQLWRLSGDLVRSALVLGLHKDPLILDPNIPSLQAEIRRGLWYTIAGLDVEHSISCCMPSLVQNLQYSCRVPSSNNNRVPEGAGETPGSEAHAQGIKESYQLVMAQSLPVRLRALRILTEISPSILDIQKVLTQLELERQRASQAQILPSIEESAEPAEIFHVAILDMLFRRPMISLRTLELQCIKVDSPNYQPIAFNGTAQCIAVLSISETFDPAFSNNEAISDIYCWNAFHALNGDDILRAAYCAGLYMTSATELTLDFKSVVRRMIDNLIKSSVRNKADLRSILKQLMGLGLVSGLVKDHRGDRKQKFMQIGLDKVLQLCRERHDASDSQMSDRLLDYLDTDNRFDLFMEPDIDLDYNPFNWNLDMV
jgi:hypothetical protein